MKTIIETLDPSFQKVFADLAEKKFAREEKEQGFIDLFGRTHKSERKDGSNELAK